MTNKVTDNLVVLPRLFERHHKLALAARETEDYETARQHLEKAVLLQPDRMEVMVDLLITYHDLELHEKAKILAGEFLQKGYGHISDILRMYVVSAIQLEHYGEVCDTLLRVFKEDELSSAEYEEFHEIYRVCESFEQSIFEDPEEQPALIRAAVQEKLAMNAEYETKLIKELEADNFDRQMRAIEQLKYLDSPRTIQALKDMLVASDADPVLKTFALSALNQLGEKGYVDVRKWGEVTQTDIACAPNIEKGLSEADQEVVDLVIEKTYHDDPMFPSFALQWWIEYFYASYPFQPRFNNAEDWAAALHLATEYSLGRDPSALQIAKLYEASPTAFLECFALIERLNLKSRVDGE